MNPVEIISAFEPYVPYLAIVVTAVAPVILERRRAASVLQQKKLELTYKRKSVLLNEFIDAYYKYSESLDMQDCAVLLQISARVSAEFSEPCRIAVRLVLDKLKQYKRPTTMSDELFQKALPILGNDLLAVSYDRRAKCQRYRKAPHEPARTN